MKDDKVYLRQILEMIRRVEENSRQGKDAFMASHTLQDAVLRNLHTMTETSQRLSDRLKASHPDVEWARIAAFRNVLVHDYLGIDLVLVWNIIQNDVPQLKNAVQQMLGGPG
ncbi:MAG: DUF86 domain-containing protein [Candidatus Eisenbacteria sp.]|nr:DUF86 domain-containing protein [Candidatus Eisenbacteria bacterium]